MIPHQNGNKIAFDQRLKAGEPLPGGVELHWQSDRPPRVAVARSDWDHFQGAWHNARALPDVSLLPPEALYRFTDVDMSFDGGIRLRDGTLIFSPWLGARLDCWNLPGERSEAGVINEPIVNIALKAVGFGHWFLHRLSRLATANRQASDRRIAVCAAPWNPPFIWEAFGLDPNEALTLARRKLDYWRVKDVLIPTYSTPLAFPRVTDASRMRNDVADLTRGIGGSRGDGFGPEKVFLVRTAAASTRPGVREPERLLAAFERRGFVPVDITALTFADQVRLIRSARVIAGEVGSFSMNAIFAEPGLGVITVAARSLNKGEPYEVGNKTFTRGVTDAFEHHQRRIIVSDQPRAHQWEINFDVLEAALETMPEIP